MPTALGLITTAWTFIVGALGGGFGLWATARFTTFADRFLNHKFDERLERYKSELSGEIERLKAKLSHTTDRATRSNELEYEAITAAWAKFIEAYQATNRCIVRWHEHPNFNEMAPEKLDAYLTLIKMSDSNKEYLKSAEDKNAAWLRIEDNRLLGEARKAIYEAHEVLDIKGIFIPSELETEFKAGLEMCSKGWAAEKAVFDKRETDATSKMVIEFMEKGAGIVKALKEVVRSRILAAYPEDKPVAADAV